MQDIHYFAGGNTAHGFVSCFDAILPAARQKRMVYIKGGPGVGKSTLMKRFAQAAQQKGLDVERFHCSSDPDSLDGVALPALGIGLMDGTAPHVYDPVVPGARDTLLALGDYLNEKALAPHTGKIIALQKEISGAFARCYGYLGAAAQLPETQTAESSAETRGLLKEFTGQLPLRGGTGMVRRLFGAAFTPRGRVEVCDLSRFERRFTAGCAGGAQASWLMTRLAENAAARGLDAVLLCDALLPDRAAQLLLPAHGMAFCTQLPETTDEARGLLFSRAVEQLACAKRLHDELESIYIPAMDFTGWQTALDRVLALLP